MVYFVGAGTGAVDLITVRGMHLLQQADVIIYAGSLVNPELLAYAQKTCEIHDSARLTLEEVMQIMSDANAREKTIVRLHTGDPSIYGAIREQMDELDQRGIPYESCPGVSACFGAASSLNLEYTLPGISQSLIITRIEGNTKVPKRESIESFAAHQASMAVYLSAGKVGELCEKLLAGGYQKETPAVLVYKATWPEEKVYLCTVGTLYDTAKEYGIRKTALILVGDAIAHQNYQRSRLYAPDFSTEFRQAKEQTAVGKVPMSAEKELRLGIISFTADGQKLSRQAAEKLCREETGIEVSLYTAARVYAGQEADQEGAYAVTYVDSVSAWTGEQMKEQNAVLFIGACGIAVRMVSPYLTDKLHDVPVLVMDEKGHHVIPILSGHMGGGNELALLLAEKLLAEPVITTATDLNGKFAVDLFAKRNGLSIVNKEGIAKVSARALAGEEITISIEPGHCDSGKHAMHEEPFRTNNNVLPKGVRILPYPPKEPVDVVVTSKEGVFDTKILLQPQKYVIGFGCKKGKKTEEITDFIAQKLSEAGILKAQVAALSSITQKQKEPGLVAWCKREHIPFITYTAEELQQVEGNFCSSDFVNKQVGVGNVCERAALKFCGPGGKLIIGKCAMNGMTIAIAEREWKVRFYEE